GAASYGRGNARPAYNLVVVFNKSGVSSLQTASGQAFGLDSPSTILGTACSPLRPYVHCLADKWNLIWPHCSSLQNVGTRRQRTLSSALCTLNYIALQNANWRGADFP